MKTKFSDWKIDGYTANSPDEKYQIWVANGFLFFNDYHAHFPRETLLAGVGFFTRYKLWRELCKERNLRAKQWFTPLT